MIEDLEIRFNKNNNKYSWKEGTHLLKNSNLEKINHKEEIILDIKNKIRVLLNNLIINI